MADDFKDLLARRVRERLRLRLGPNALSLAQAGADVTLNPDEANQVADTALEVLAELGWTAPHHPDSDARQRYAEALAEKFTRPPHRFDAQIDRIDIGMFVVFTASDGYPAMRAVTPAEAADVCAAARDDDLERLQYERRLLGAARMVLDLVAAGDSSRWEQARREAEDIAQRIVDEIGHPVTDEPALGPGYRAEIAALRQRAEQAEERLDGQAWDDLERRAEHAEAALARSEDECAAVRQQLTAARMALKGAEREAEVVASGRESAQRSHKLQQTIAGSLAKELRTARAAIRSAWDVVDAMRATSPAAADWADRLSVALSKQTGDDND